MEPFSGRGQTGGPAVRTLLHFEAPPERRSWLKDDLDPEQVAREAIAEIQGALEGLYAIREMLTVSRSGKAAARQNCGPARDHRR